MCRQKKSRKRKKARREKGIRMTIRQTRDIEKRLITLKPKRREEDTYQNNRGECAVRK